MISSYKQELQTAIAAARSAQEIILDYRDSRDFQIDFKGENDLVTDADLKAEEAILDIIQEEFPNDQWLAEETADRSTLPAERTWLIDPIDGTTNFAHGFPIYCVSIALWENREPKMGVMLEVNSDDLFTAVTGEGAYLNEKPITVSSIQDPSDALVGTGFPYNDLSLIDHYLNFFKRLQGEIQGIRRPGSAAYDLCCVACGRFDGFYEYSLNAWDVAAAALIVQEAGGIITDWIGGEEWLFGERIVAGNPNVHPFLLNLLEEVIPEKHRKPLNTVGSKGN